MKGTTAGAGEHGDRAWSFCKQCCKKGSGVRLGLKVVRRAREKLLKIIRVPRERVVAVGRRRN